uniref:Receptor-like protein 12 n=1 Tax=Nicotiana tabacum TaxID=4097 RepID=A0A1S4BTD0_TOBAC
MTRSSMNPERQYLDVKYSNIYYQVRVTLTFKGRIPKSIGKLTQFESLDFSVNQLNGRIPDELVGLTFLSFLNLSFNQLSGRIPRGNQFQTFSADSFEGNAGLCDFPLKKTCSETKALNELPQPNSHSDHEIVDEKYISFSLGSSVSFGIIIWLLLYSRRYNELVDRLLFRILGQHKKSRSMNKSRRRSRWDENTDCCQWPGVSCDQEGHVLVLELDDETISGGVENSTSLFDLKYLEKLNLAYNYLYSTQIPKEIYQLTNLKYLNLSYAGFEGQIPMELSRLTKELYLDGVNISLNGSDWCSALSSSLPQLTVLSMIGCDISGPLDSALLNLHFLSIIRLDYNMLSTVVPEFLANFTKLTTLSLSKCNLRGVFPSKIFQIPTLHELDLYDNENLTGILPEFPRDGSLRDVDLSYTSFTGTLPDSIFNLTTLTKIDVLQIQNNRFSGEVHEFANASSSVLETLDLSNNHLNGSIPR